MITSSLTLVCAVDSLLPPAMSDRHCCFDFFKRCVLRWQRCAEEFDDISTAEQRQFIPVKNALIEQKRLREKNERHMMMPRIPAPYLIIGHPAFPFCIFKSTLNPIPLRLHVGKSL